ncbi:DUF3823 domain-containing protein [Sphingobacterium sp. N143]|uniref:DUF3823 domain-containing protein n=1 Tax=Sphingobacterium sp. N143 TaxID=2746727 RepID=UPI002575E242|nr:DUF3823 domain-containing protein [Sphingobacterium sp. N143]MDM1292757.1 DUF3823 domain-containing protein [Sphingobacterium sp. N143]
MRTFFCKLIVSFGVLINLFACGKDNYDAPESALNGQVTYQGKPIGVRGSNQSVYLQLWQDGYQLRSPVNVYLTQDGSFSTKLFDGTYKLVTTSGNGPWISSGDTLLVQVKGNTRVDFQVKPYYTLDNIVYRIEGNMLKASFDVQTIDATRPIDFAMLMVNDTKFVDLGQYSYKIEKSDVTSSHVELELDMKDILTKSSAVYARVGLKINGITEALYDSSPQKLK